MTIEEALAKRTKLRAEAATLWAEARKLWFSNKLHAESDRLFAETRKLRAEADLVVINTVIEYHGPETIIMFDDDGIEIKCETTLTLTY